MPKSEVHIVRFGRDLLPEPEGEVPTEVMYQLDTDGGMTQATADRNADNFAMIAGRYPTARLAWFLADFDGDPRSLVDIPEARAFLGMFGQALTERDPAMQIRPRLPTVQQAMLLIGMGLMPRENLIIVPSEPAATMH